MTVLQWPISTNYYKALNLHYYINSVVYWVDL